MKLSNKSQALYDLIAPAVAACGVDLWGIEFLPQGKRSLLRIFIDKPGGITIDFAWKDRCITECSLQSQTDMVRILLYNGIEKKIMLKADTICHIV